MNRSILLSLLSLISFSAALIGPRFGMSTTRDPFSSSVYMIGGSTVPPLVYPSFPETKSFPEQQDRMENATATMQVFNSGSELFSSDDWPSMKVRRSHHTATYFNGSILVFGGAEENNDVEVFDIATRTWSVLPSSFLRPAGRWGHTASIFVNGTEAHLYVFGGIGADCKARNDLWVLDLNTLQWTDITPALNPPARGGHIMEFDPSQGGLTLFIAYGTDYATRYFDDVWTINLDRPVPQWADVTPSLVGRPRPEARAFPAVVSTSFGAVLFFGGVGYGDPNKVPDFFYFNDFWVIADGVEIPLEKPNTFVGPSGRAAAGAFLAGDSTPRLYIVSGRNHQRKPLGDIWSFNLDSTFSEWEHVCFPDHEYPDCISRCEAQDVCGFGECVDDIGTQCICDEGWQSVFGNCDFNPCDGYRGFRSWEMNEILLPGSIFCIIDRMTHINRQLLELRNILPPINKADCIDLKSLAVQSLLYYNTCLADICHFADGFEDLIGCQVPCGSETKCIIGDTCINGQCVGGYEKNCTEEWGNNMCVEHSCDERAGCVHRVKDCNDFNECTNDWCHPERGCVHEPLEELNNTDCCALVTCNNGVVTTTQKCDDHDPCSVDTCNRACSWGACEHTFIPNCIPSAGQNPCAAGLDGMPRSRGAGIVLSSPQSQSSLNAWLWLLEDGCTLQYDIGFFDQYGRRTFFDATATEDVCGHIFATFSQQVSGGIVYTFEGGFPKQNQWNFCSSGFCREDLFRRLFYLSIPVNGRDYQGVISWDEQRTCVSNNGPYQYDK